MRNSLFIAWTFDHYLDCHFIPHVISPRQALRGNGCSCRNCFENSFHLLHQQLPAGPIWPSRQLNKSRAAPFPSALTHNKNCKPHSVKIGLSVFYGVRYLPYEDLDGTFELHASLINRSATAKLVGATGELIGEFEYEPAA